MRYLALGDSYSIGEGVPEAGRWPMQLAAALRQAGIAVDDPRIIATTGWTTDELAAAMDAAEPLDTWDMVSLLIGVNNQYRGRQLDEYSEQFTALLERAITLAGNAPSRVFVLSIPDWSVTPFAQGHDRGAIAHQIDAFNATAHAICLARHVTFIDITPISRLDGGETHMLAADGLHPSATMYARWVELITNQVNSLPDNTLLDAS